MNDRVLLDTDLKTIGDIIDTPAILFNEKQVIRLNDRGRLFPVADAGLKRLFFAYSMYKKVKIKEKLQGTDGVPMSIRIAALRVTYNGETFLIGEIQEAAPEGKLTVGIGSAVYRLMLEMTQKMGRFSSEEEISHFILEYSQKAVKNYGFCSVMSVQDGSAVIVEKAGYSDQVYGMKMPVEDTFLYRATDGKCDRIVNIGNLQPYDNVYSREILSAEEDCRICSTISAPIYIDGVLTGMINLDSIQTNAFDEEDTALLSLVKNNVEIALTNRKLHQKALNAELDYLTGCGNRRYFEKTFYDADKKNLWIVQFDMNNLKPVNDNYGHAWGDRIICDFARKLDQCRQNKEVIARMGGDEFAGIFYAESEQALAERMEALQETIRKEPVSARGEQIAYSFSYGICGYESGESEEMVLRNMIKCADDRMYRYKAAYKKTHPSVYNDRDMMNTL